MTENYDGTPEMRPTHKGWMLFCPVYLDMTIDESPGVWARWECLEPLLTLAHWVQVSAIYILSALDEDYEPEFMLRITGDMK